MKTQTKTTVTAQIPKSLAKRLDALAKTEKRSKSFYIKEALERFLDNTTEDVLDYMEASKRYSAFVSSGNKGVTLPELKKKYNL